MSSIKVSLGSREIVKYLRILTALSEDQGLFPSTHSLHMQLHFQGI